MYLDGSSISAIGRVLHIKLGTVYSWVKKSPTGGEVDAAAGTATGGEVWAGPGHLVG